MSNPTTARDELNALVRTAWLADALTLAIPLAYDDLKFTKPGNDANGEPLPWARVTVRHGPTSTETIGGEGIGKDQHSGFVRVQIFTAAGFGRATGDVYAQIAKRSLQRKRITHGWTYDANITEGLEEGPWVITNVTASFFYEEQL